MAGRTITRPPGDPAPEYQAILDRMRELATAPASEDPATNSARVYGLWAIQDAAHDILRIGMAVVNEGADEHPPRTGSLSYSDLGALFDKHRATIAQHVDAARHLRGNPRPRNPRKVRAVTPSKRAPWTDEELAMADDPDLSAGEVAAASGRTLHAVRGKRRELRAARERETAR
jgi:hypothetical protein